MNSVCRTLQTTSTLRSPIEFRKRDVILDVNLTLLERPKGLYELSQKVSVLVGDNFWSLAYLSTWFLLNVIITLYCKAYVLFIAVERANSESIHSVSSTDYFQFTSFPIPY